MINRRPVIAITTCWLLGNIIFSNNDTITIILWIASLLLIAIITVLLRRCTIILALILVGCLIAGAGQRYMVDLHNKTALVEEWDNSLIETFETKVIGTITSLVEIDGDRVSFDMETSQIFRNNGVVAHDISEKFKVYITLQAEEELEIAKQWKRGLNIQLTGEISRPAIRNNDGGFDYRQYLKYSRIHWLLKSKGIHSIKQLPDEESFSIIRFKAVIDELRVKISAPLDQLFSKEQSGYLKGLILGIREELDPEQFRQFSTLGLTHILAISGLHVAVFMYIVTVLLRIFRFSKERIIYILLVLIPLYVAITGASPSILRAGLMAMLGLIAVRMNILKDGLHLIAIVALALVIINPYMIHNVSFQLSFIVTIGLIIGVPALSKALPRTKKSKWLMDSLAVTLVAQFISFPLSIYYFNQFHLLSFVANLILVPFISFIVMPLASFVMIISHVHLAITKPFVLIVQWCNEASFNIVALLSKVHQLHFIWATQPIWWIIGWYVLLLAFFAELQTQYANSSEMVIDRNESNKETVPLHGIEELNILYPNRKVSYFRKHGRLFMITILTVGCLIYAYEPLLFTRSAYVSFLDVGQGDASYIRTPSGKHILIDGGGTVSFGKSKEQWKLRQDPFEVGKDVLVPLLMKRGVHRLDILIISHLDSDHIGGLIEVIKTIPVEEVWWNGSYKDSADIQQLFSIILEKNITLRSPIIGEKIEVDDATTFEILWPLEVLPTEVEMISEQNEHSLVMILHLFKHSFLYTGDIGERAEENIVNQLYSNNEVINDISVMKVGHHGSRYSTGYSWLSYFEPKTSIISVGRYNVYGHPHPLVLSRLEQYNSIIFRTDQLGEVKLRATNDDIYFMNWK